MDYIRVTKENLENESICCANSNHKDIQVISKKAWLSQRFDDGLVFLKSAVRGKCFIEYILAENAWVPIEADGFLHINCMWVSGALKGHGYASELLDFCIKDGKQMGKQGICILSSTKKKPYLADPKFLKHKDFLVSDEADNGIQLWYLPFENNVTLPKFKEQAKHPHIHEKGFVLYYTNQCPFTAKYVPLIEKIAKENDQEFHAIHLKNKVEAQNAPTPVTTYALFYNGKYKTNEILSEKKFLKILQEGSESLL